MWCSWDADEVVPGWRWVSLLHAASYLDFPGAVAACASVGSSTGIGPWLHGRITTMQIFVYLGLFLSRVQRLLCRSEK